MTRKLTRADLDALPSYVPGRSPADLARELGLRRRSSWPATRCRTARCPAWSRRSPRPRPASHRYPDMGVVALREALAERYGVSPDRIATGCGSVALAEHLARVTCLPGDEIVYSWRSFEAYPIIAATTGATSVRVPNDRRARARPRGDGRRRSPTAPGMILVCNPNNPTGTASGRADLDRFLDAVPVDVLVVLDEAYREFVTDPDVPDGLEVYGDRPNVVVLRTLSKAWGLAGLRIGFLVAQPEVAAAVRKVVTPFSTSAVAQAAALAALQQAEEVRRRCALVVAERERVTEAVRRLVPDVPPRPRPTSSGCRWATGRPSSAPPARSRA